MKKFFRHIASCLAAFLLLTGQAATAAEPLQVTASFSILADLVRAVGGERVAVTALVGPDEDAHAFEPKPSDAKQILQSKLWVTNGLGFEPWAQKLVRSAGYKGASVVASQGIEPLRQPAQKGHSHGGHGHEEADPHAWQDPVRVVKYVQNIAAALAKADPAGAATYQRNADAYVQELQALDAWAKAQFAALPAHKRKVITSHDAFGYFGARYQIRFLAPQGMSTQTEPSAKAVAQLIRQMQREKIRAIFIENMSNPKLLTQLSKDAGAAVGPALYVDALSGPAGPASTYLQLIRHNVTQLAAGMRQN